MIAANCWNEVVVVQRGDTTTVPIASIAGQQRLVPGDHPLLAMVRAVGASLGV
jgi:6-phosphofructokinase 1